MWKLMHTGTTQHNAKDSELTGVPLIVIETKHQASLSLKTAGQAISYYSRASCSIHSTLKVYKFKMEVGIDKKY